MPLLTVANLRTSPIALADPSGLSGVSFTVPASGSVTNLAMTLLALASIEPQLIAEATLANITWTVADDPASSADTLPEHISTVLASPYNGIAGDQAILTNLTVPGAVSVVLSAAAKIGQLVQVIDAKGDAGANNVTITVASAGTINGGANVVINTNRGMAWLMKTGTNAWVSVSSASISSGAAGGDLAGTYPNPTLNAMFVSAPQALSGAGAVNVTTRTTLFTSTGVNALTLANGTRAGQRKTLFHTVDGGSGVLTPATAGNFATATVSVVKDFIEFEWSGAAWNVVGYGGSGVSFT
jgi:hypothetical protein